MQMLLVLGMSQKCGVKRLKHGFELLLGERGLFDGFELGERAVL